jgi:hypothetical protein
VWVLVNYRRLGGPDANLLRDYPSLTPADLDAAWEYAAANPQEIDRAIRENEHGEEASPHSGILSATQDPHNHVALAGRIDAALVGRLPGRWCLRVNRPARP